MKKRIFVIGSIVLVTLICFLGISFGFKKDLTIDEILETKSYSYLSPRVKSYIKDHYLETGELLLTKDNAKEGQPYLNPAFIYYLDNSDSSENFGVVPNELTVKNHIVGNGNGNELPSKYDLRDVDGHNYVSPVKDQGVDGICWAYAMNAVIETYYLRNGVTKYLSEQQLNYATSTDGVDVETNEFVNNQHYSRSRQLGGGAFVSTPLSVLIDGVGAVSESWNNSHTTQIVNHKKIPAHDVYNLNNSNIEVDETTIFEYDPANMTEEEKQEVINVIKNGVMEYGGASVSVLYSFWSKTGNQYAEEDTVVYEPEPRVNHALQLIGWDDDYEYSFCRYMSDVSSVVNIGRYHYEDGEKVYECGDDYNGTGVNITGKGVWIFKNSWGNTEPYIYVTYDTYISEVAFITKYDTREWDNTYDVYFDDTNNTPSASTHDEYILGYSFSLEDIYMPNNEKLFKIKLNNMMGFDFELYISNDNGSTFSKVTDYAREFPGYIMLDFSESNYIINNNTIFSIVSKNSLGSPVLHIYTKNIDESVNADSTNVSFDSNKEDYNTSNYVDINLHNHLKNINDHTSLTVRIKDSNEDYLPNNAFEIINNYSYINIICIVSNKSRS